MQVEPELSMRAAHAIGERVRHTLVRDFPLLTEAQIHIGNSSDSPLQCGSVEVWKCGRNSEQCSKWSADPSDLHHCSPPLALSEGEEEEEEEEGGPDPVPMRG